MTLRRLNIAISVAKTVVIYCCQRNVETTSHISKLQFMELFNGSLLEEIISTQLPDSSSAMNSLVVASSIYQRTMFSLAKKEKKKKTRKQEQKKKDNVFVSIVRGYYMHIYK